MKKGNTCPVCGKEQKEERYFCAECGSFLDRDSFEDKQLYELSEIKIKRILENLKYTPHSQILWSDMVDLYTRKVETYRALTMLPEMKGRVAVDLPEKMEHFLRLCREPEFQIAFVGTIKTGKSTLINALLGHNYASMAVTPETAALTKFRSSQQDYVDVTFYSAQEWKRLWDSRTSAADAFMREYKKLCAESEKENWVGHAPIHKELANEEIERELAKWSSSRSAVHYFVKEIEVGISSLPADFPKQVVFVDTPGLSDPVVYRSEITKQYIRNANAVFVCVQAKTMEKSQIETIASVFSFSFHNKSKVYIMATQFDTFNCPKEDWEEQNGWMKKQLVGPGFYDTEELAETHIMPSSAYIYNLCRDFSKLNDDEQWNITNFAHKMRLNYKNLKVELPKIMAVTNIMSIEKEIKENLAGNYQTLLCQDIEKAYKDIHYELKRFVSEQKKETGEIIQTSFANMQEVEKKLEEQKRNYEEVQKNKEQLAEILHMVEENTRKSLDQFLALKWRVGDELV